MTKQSNRLIHENSPYLLSHSHNPVDWYPWGTEALERAKNEDKPIFLSIGYAACHWCHVMERESFENEQIAELMNRHFVCIKVDREQRPDLDQIYMSFTQAMTGSGGWPMSVFLTPDLKPFFAGTYFPPEDRYGHPAFPRVLTQLAEAYRTDKSQILTSAQEIFATVSAYLTDNSAPHAMLTRDIINRGAEQLMKNFDSVNGGFGGAPKFPHPTELSFFLRQSKSTGDIRYQQAAELALTPMAHGGIYDQLGGGFSRYSVDQRWLVPHFEKMLYDNALLVPVYVDAWRITKNESYRNVVRETLNWMLREMSHPDGGYYSALDADSEGVEGKFYVWSFEEFNNALGDDADLFARYFNVTPQGNFEHHNILNLTHESFRIAQSTPNFESRLGDAKSKLLAVRDTRVRPLTDDKLLTSWNGLALFALCRGYQITHDERYRVAAIKNATFVQNALWKERQLTHSWREGKHSTGQFLEDFAYYLRGVLDLYEIDIEIDGNERWLEFANELADTAVALFMDSTGDLYLREDSQTDLIIRPREESDSALPSRGAIFLQALLRLSRITGQTRFHSLAERGLRQLSGKMERYPSNMISSLHLLDDYLSDRIDIVLVGKSNEREGMLATLYEQYAPNRIIAVSESGKSIFPLFAGRPVAQGVTSAYLCRNESCRLPVTTAEELKSLIS